MRNLKKDGEIRWSADKKPSLGGLSFYIIFLLSISIYSLLPFENNAESGLQIIGVVGACSLGFVLGLADDAYNTNPLVKFISQLTCAFILIVTNVYIEVTGNPSIDFAITTLWVIGLMNSINMLDNMDGITATTSISIIGGIVAILIFKGMVNSGVLVLLLGVLGALIGFLYYNWNPAKMYMGDTGSQFLGVFLAAISILYLWNCDQATTADHALAHFALPALLFIVPLIDTTTVTIRRLMKKQSPFVGGRDHITHHLVYFGLSDKMTVSILWALSLSGLPIVLLVVSEYWEWNLYFSIGAIVYLVIAFLVMQLVYNIGKNRKAAKDMQASNS